MSELLQEFSSAPVLENQFVRLEPLAPTHADQLAEAVKPGELWNAWYTRVPAPDQVADEIQRRLGLQTEGKLAPWAVIDPQTEQAVGMSTYLNIDHVNRRVEIGNTWIGRAAQGTLINPAMKLLLLSRAFDDLDCIAVEFRTHWHNRQSRAAIARLGAKQDGVLRNHSVMPNGTLRDTVVFSILDTEWPAVRAGLEHRLLEHRLSAHGVESRG